MHGVSKKDYVYSKYFSYVNQAIQQFNQRLVEQEIRDK